MGVPSNFWGGEEMGKHWSKSTSFSSGLIMFDEEDRKSMLFTIYRGASGPGVALASFSRLPSPTPWGRRKRGTKSSLKFKLDDMLKKSQKARLSSEMTMERWERWTFCQHGELKVR
jgi:hypothetical protein